MKQSVSCEEQNMRKFILQEYKIKKRFIKMFDGNNVTHSSVLFSYF